MSDEKRQHLVPKCYLKNFAVKAKKEWQTDVYDKAEKKYFKAGINNVCVQSEFYTFSKLPDDKKRFLEKFYGANIETDFPNIYDLLTDPSVKKVDKKMRIKILAFIFSQFTRTSKLTNIFNSFWNRSLERGYEMINPENEDQKIYFDGGGHVDFKDKTLEEVQRASDNENREYINLKNFERFYDLATRRLKDHFSIYKTHAEHKLITSDNPVISTNFMYDPKSHFHMPLDERHMILLLPFQPDMVGDNKDIYRTNMVHEMSYIQTITNNIQQIENAERYVIGSRDGLENAVYEMDNLDIENLSSRSEAFAENIKKTSNIIQQVLSPR